MVAPKSYQFALRISPSKSPLKGRLERSPYFYLYHTSQKVPFRGNNVRRSQLGAIKLVCTNLKSTKQNLKT